MLRVDLTTGSGGDGSRLRVHYEELIRRVKRKYGYDVVSFVVETGEGNGVLHCVWAIKSDGATWVDQAWMSDVWLDIHGAPIVYIRRMGNSKKDSKRVSVYFANQYLAGQESFVRFSYSWKKLGVVLGRSWNIFKRECRKYSLLSTWCGLNPSTETVSREEMFLAWEEFLTIGKTIVGVSEFTLANGVPVVKYAN